MTSTRSERDRRLAEIEAELAQLRAQWNQLIKEKLALEKANAAEDWPDGPFTLHNWRHHSEDNRDYDEPLEAVRMAAAISDNGDGFPEKVTDRHGRTIYKLGMHPWKRVADGYPEMLEDEA